MTTTTYRLSPSVTALSRLVRMVEDVANGETRPRIILTERDVEEKILLSAMSRVEELRVDRDPTDLFDHDGAAANFGLMASMLKRTIYDDVVDLAARIVAVTTDSSCALEGACEHVGADLPPEKATAGAIKRAADRIGYTNHVTAAWARDGFRTYDLTHGLYTLLLGTEDDPVVQGMPPGVAWKFPAFAIRLPGPDYPIITDPNAGPYEVRGCIVAQYDDAPSQEAWALVRENMRAVANEVEEDVSFRDLVDGLYSAGRAAFGRDTVRSLACCFAGWRDGRPVGSALENGFLRVRAWANTTRDAIIEAAGNAAGHEEGDAEREPAYRRLLNVIFGTGLWLTYAGDEGVPRKARPVRLKSMSITPKAYVLGRGVKEVIGR